MCTIVLVFTAGDFSTNARNDKAVRNLSSLPPRGKVDCRSIAKARRMRGKRRYVYYRDFIPLIRQTIYTEPLRRRDEGVPPYRRLRREYVMASFQPIVYIVISTGVRGSPNAAEKSPAGGEPPRASVLARVRGWLFVSTRLPRRALRSSQ